MSFLDSWNLSDLNSIRPVMLLLSYPLLWLSLPVSKGLWNSKVCLDYLVKISKSLTLWLSEATFSQRFGCGHLLGEMLLYNLSTLLACGYHCLFYLTDLHVWAQSTVSALKGVGGTHERIWGLGESGGHSCVVAGAQFPSYNIRAYVKKPSMEAYTYNDMLGTWQREALRACWMAV